MHLTCKSATLCLVVWPRSYQVSTVAAKAVLTGRIISRGLTMNRIFLLTALLGMILLAVGCGETVAHQQGQTITLEKVEYAAAFQSALDAVRQSFPIEKQDLQSGQIISRPVVYSSNEPSERLSTGLSGARQELRSKAQLNLSKRPDGCAVEVRVDVERRDTRDYQVYEGILAAEDLRMRTPAERRDLAGPDQGEVWTFVRRDRAAEELIISAIRERLGLLEPSSP